MTKEPRAIRPNGVMRLSADAMALRWGISARRVRKLCQERKIFSARKIDGEWTIPVTADRPLDGRSYRYRRVPKHLEDIVRHADATLRDAGKRQSPFKPEDRKLFFLQGSAFHLHKLSPSTLTFNDVREVIAGRAVGGKSIRDQLAVLWHVAAIKHVFEAVRQRRRISIRFVEELKSILACGCPDGRVRYRDGLDSTCRSAADRVAELTARLNSSVMHPIVQAGIFLGDFILAEPFVEDNERTAYLVSNFLLLKKGYPPVIIYRALFNAAREYREKRQLMIEEDNKLSKIGTRMPHRLFPSLRAGFFSAVLARAVCWSCKKNLHLIRFDNTSILPEDYGSQIGRALCS